MLMSRIRCGRRWRSRSAGPVRVTPTVDAQGPAVELCLGHVRQLLHPQDVGRLRGALRDAVLAAAEQAAAQEEAAKAVRA